VRLPHYAQVTVPTTADVRMRAFASTSRQSISAEGGTALSPSTTFELDVYANARCSLTIMHSSQFSCTLKKSFNSDPLYRIFVGTHLSWNYQLMLINKQSWPQGKA